LGPIPNPQSPIPNPQSPSNFFDLKIHSKIKYNKNNNYIKFNNLIM